MAGIINDADQIITTYDLNTYSNAVFLSDAAISFSDNMHAFIENEYGFSFGDTVWSWVCKVSPNGPLETLATLSTVTINMKSDGPYKGLIINRESDGNIVGAGAGGKNNPIFFSSLTYSIAPYNPDQQPIPEPSTAFLFGLGLLGLVAGNRKNHF
ncbi:MAG: PEP-CTERM sorting domain-containing protein [Desulfobacter sp.]|nr:MAG: PEP-CTERM sorting domain-containing protein [Desulfobacter sp.]